MRTERAERSSLIETSAQLIDTLAFVEQGIETSIPDMLIIGIEQQLIALDGLDDGVVLFDVRNRCHTKGV